MPIAKIFITPKKDDTRMRLFYCSNSNNIYDEKYLMPMTKIFSNSSRKAINNNQKKMIVIVNIFISKETTLPQIPQEPEQQNLQYNYPN
ncbi:24860_t:CDS:1, partial [Gigaspora margarita]